MVKLLHLVVKSDVNKSMIASKTFPDLDSSPMFDQSLKYQMIFPVVRIYLNIFSQLHYLTPDFSCAFSMSSLYLFGMAPRTANPPYCVLSSALFRVMTKKQRFWALLSDLNYKFSSETSTYVLTSSNKRYINYYKMTVKGPTAT